MKKTSKRRSAKATTRLRPPYLRAEYDFGKGVRGKYAKRGRRGTYIVLLDPDLAAAFRSEEAVNKALREYLRDRSK